jgi:hypothetical protein
MLGCFLAAGFFKRTNHLMSDPTYVYKVLTSGDGKQVQQLLEKCVFDMQGMMWSAKQDHRRAANCILKTEAFNKAGFARATITDRSLDGDPDDIEGEPAVSIEQDYVRFFPVRVATRNIGMFTKDQEDTTKLIGALQDLTNYQFRHQDPDDPNMYVYNLPVPEKNQDMPVPSMMVTNDLLHTTICWKEVITGDGSKTLAVAHVNAQGFRYKKFHDMVEVQGILQVMVPGVTKVFKKGPIDGCWGPRDYFAHDRWNRQRSERTLGGSCVVIGVWDKASRSWHLYAQVRRHDEVKRVVRIYPR